MSLDHEHDQESMELPHAPLGEPGMWTRALPSETLTASLQAIFEAANQYTYADNLWREQSTTRHRGRVIRALFNLMGVIEAERASLDLWGTIELNQNRHLLLNDYPTCRMCSSMESLAVDHIIPRSRGGNHSLSNLQLLCRACNSSKSTKTMSEWVGWLIKAETEGAQRVRDRIQHSWCHPNQCEGCTEQPGHRAVLDEHLRLDRSMDFNPTYAGTRP